MKWKWTGEMDGAAFATKFSNLNKKHEHMHTHILEFKMANFYLQATNCKREMHASGPIY